MTNEIQQVQQALANYDREGLKQATANLAAARGRVPITTQVNEKVYDDLRKQAANEGLSLAQFIEKLLARRAVTHGYWI